MDPEEVTDYGWVKYADTQFEAYRRQLREVAFGLDYHSQLTTQKIQAVGL